MKIELNDNTYIITTQVSFSKELWKNLNTIVGIDPYDELTKILTITMEEQIKDLPKELEKLNA